MRNPFEQLRNIREANLDIAWETATVNIPELAPNVKALIETVI